MKILFQLMAILFIVLVANPVFAVRVNSIYKADLPVASQSAKDRSHAVLQGFTQVLVKVTGNSRILDNPSVKAWLKNAESLIEEYSYKSQDNVVNAPYLLELNFDPEGINKLLRDAGIPTWGQNRPLILAWVEFEAPDHPAEIVGSDSDGDIHVLLKQYSDQRGLPMLLPMMDVTDLNQVAVSDVVTMSLPTLQNAAKRYGSDALLVGHIMQADAGLTSQWKLTMGNNQWNWNISGQDLPEVLSTVVNNVADNLAARYAVVISNNVQTELTLNVTGVKQAAELTQLMTYLQRLSTVAEVRLVRVSNEGVILSVSLRGSKQAFIQATALGKMLKPQPGIADENTLNYLWVIE